MVEVGHWKFPIPVPSDSLFAAHVAHFFSFFMGSDLRRVCLRRAAKQRATINGLAGAVAYQR